MLGLFLGISAGFAQEPAPAATSVHRSEVEVVTPISPRFAKGAPADLRCLARVEVDQAGAPTAVSVSGCEEPWATAASEAALQGRWKLREGQVAPLSFVVPIAARPVVAEADLIFVAAPALPRTLAVYALGEVACGLRLDVTAAGAVDAVTFVDACPEPLRASLAASGPEWKLEPHRVGGEAIPFFAELTYEANSGGAAVFQNGEMQIKRRVMPTLPAEARRAYAAGAEVDCKAHVFVDAAGAPHDVRFDACPELFHRSTREALMQWKWYPAEIEGQPVKAQFLMNVKYRIG